MLKRKKRVTENGRKNKPKSQKLFYFFLHYDEILCFVGYEEEKTAHKMRTFKKVNLFVHVFQRGSTKFGT